MSTALIGQSGGPTSVINSSLAGLIDGCEIFTDVDRVLGMRWGVEGLMAGNLVDLSAEPAENIAALRRTPSSALGSSRHKVTDADLPRILDRLREFDIGCLFMIGGNDTMDTIHRVTAYAAGQGYGLVGVGVPKTVDNDLYGTDHTPGYPSAARYTALSVQQSATLARDMQKVDQFVIYQSIGRDAGWLAAASVMGKLDEHDGPHLVYMPERVFDADRFLADVESARKAHGFVSIVCGEGLKYADGTPVSASRTTDKFANVEYGAMGGSSVAMQLHRMISERFGWRGEFQITESLPMCAIDRASRLDLQEAYDCGQAAARLAGEGRSGVMVTLQRKPGDAYESTTGTAELADVAVRAKPMPDAFINDAGNFPSRAFVEYLEPLIGPLADYARLTYAPAKK
ncbi:MAG: Pyrophosphate--fructose 6-phosphate 1-phosphotransferase [Phycisphaerae bacterium]|nr:Pyrophosphate--fructose 6-phosphate 1-phosphotransferase [Phycisphaerae bacterium]